MPTGMRLATCDDILLGYNYQIKAPRWGITTSAGSYPPAQRFDPPMHWDTSTYKLYPSINAIF